MLKYELAITDRCCCIIDCDFRAVGVSVLWCCERSQTPVLIPLWLN